MKDSFNSLWTQIKDHLAEVVDLFTTPIFELGENEISLATIIYVILGFIVLVFLASRLKRLVIERILSKSSMSEGAKATAGTLTKFFMMVIGAIVIMQSAGIDLSALTLVAGALGVGIGFGLQNITDNFISGIIILFEKPIKVGDRIEVGEIEGDVTKVSFRATHVLTNDNISIIVPNSEFISNKVINWSHNDRNIRFRIPIGVSYKEDPAHIRAILLEAAHKNPHVLKSPAPSVIFHAFGDSSLDFQLAVWTTSHTDKPQLLKSELYFAIFKQFKEENVEIPFPQRDIHIRTQVPPTVPGITSIAGDEPPQE